jgi:FG-GAP repeat
MQGKLPRARLIRAALFACAGLWPCGVDRARAQADCDTFTMKASDPHDGGNFGSAIVAQGDTCVVGAPAVGTDAAAYTFRRTAIGTWIQESKLVPPASPSGSSGLFGHALAIDGARLVVGGPAYGSAGGALGAVWIYEKNLSVWTLVDVLFSPDGTTDARFGSAVALSGDYLLVGAPGVDRGVLNSGAAFVYRRSPAGSWVKAQALRASDPTTQAEFGAAVAMRGNVAMIGAPKTNVGAFFTAGAVYAFQLTGEGWTEQQKLTSSIPFNNGSYGVSLSLDGDVAAVGAPIGKPSSPTGAGSVHLYVLQPDSQWLLSEVLTGFDAIPYDQFGRSVCLCNDWLAVGAPRKDLGWSDRGAVYLFRAFGDDWKNWAPWFVADSAEGDRLGESVALATAQVLAGAPYKDGPAANAGAAFSREISNDQLLSCPRQISVTGGGLQQLRLEAGLEHGAELYLMLGSLSGTSPGITVDGQHVPLNPDEYFLQTLGAPNLPPWFGSLGFTNKHGQASMQVSVPAGAYAALAGRTVHHAVLTWKAFALGPITFVSNPTELQLLP